MSAASVASPPYPARAGYRWVAASFERDRWRPPGPEDLARPCRHGYSNGRQCRARVAVVLIPRGQTRPRRLGYCLTHSGGRWVEDGRVLRWVLRPRHDEAVP